MKLQTILAVLTSLVTAVFASTVADVLGEIKKISTQTTTLNKAVTAYPITGGSLSKILNINTDALAVISVLNQGASLMKDITKPISETDSKRILAAIQDIEPVVLDALKKVVAKKPAFEKISLFGPLAGYGFRTTLLGLRTASSKLSAALLAETPAHRVSEATSINKAIDAAFDSAISAYS